MLAVPDTGRVEGRFLNTTPYHRADVGSAKQATRRDLMRTIQTAIFGLKLQGLNGRAF